MTDVTERIAEERRLRLADQLIAVKVGMGAGYSDEGHGAFVELVDQLTAGPEEEDYLTNPNAQPDWEALRSSGMVQRVPVPSGDTKDG